MGREGVSVSHRTLIRAAVLVWVTAIAIIAAGPADAVLVVHLGPYPMMYEPVPPSLLEPKPEPYIVPEPWASLAECESHGEWDYDPNTATWGTRIYEGGVQFHPDTWDAFKLDGHPHAAYEATSQEQIEVAQRVLDAQGWAAWPACSRKLGLR